MDIDEKLSNNEPEAATEHAVNSAAKVGELHSAIAGGGDDVHGADGHSTDDSGGSVPSGSNSNDHPVDMHMYAQTRPLSARQERRLVAYLDDALLDLTRNFKKRCVLNFIDTAHFY